jgi:inorganic triphosphatase YgiF
MSDGAGETIETESKFAVSAAFMVPEFTGVPGVVSLSPAQTYQLTATYFDTQDLRLIKAHVTLRRRTGGTDAGWHLKLPAGAGSRREVHEPLGSDPVTVPARLASMVAGWARKQPLRPVARLVTTRTVRRLTGNSGEVLAEVADDRVTGSVPSGQNGGWQVASSWREVEVELVDGPRDLLAAAGEALLRAGAEPSASASKVSQVLTEAGLLPPAGG